ncbi:hypothetical protein M0804_009503 [Polistes exclamans]|nr:hypothetical protein M0804_009503 [Polistes exclamans]
MESLTKFYDGKDTSRFRFKPNTFAGSLTSRSYYCKNYDDDDDDDDDKKHDLIKRQSKSANEDRISKCNKLLTNKIELNPISQLSTKNVRPIKCGGYRPHTGVILKNLSSSSESESINEPTSNCLSRKINNPITNTELSSRSEDNQSLSSFRSLQEISRNKIINNNTNNNNNNEREKIQENDLISMPEKSGGLNYSRSENVRQKNNLSDLSKHRKGKRNLSCPSTAKNCVEKEDFVSTMNTARFFSDGHSSYENNKDKIPSFVNVELIDDLETFNASDNEKQDNTTSVPSLRLYSEDVSCSTSAGSKTYTQNRSLDSNALSNALSNVSSNLNARDIENNSTKKRYRSFDDSENLDTSESSDQNLISIITRREPVVSANSKNIHENYNEFDITKGSRRAFSAPNSKLPARHLVNDQRCKSVDLSREMIYVQDNFQYPESLYSNNLSQTNLSESMGSLNFAEEYQTFKDPSEMSYLQEEKYNAYCSEYLISSIYPRQSHLSILQEESETRLEENGLSEATFENKDSPIVNVDKENINRFESDQQMSTTSSKNQNIEQQNSIKLNETNMIQDTIENSMENQCNIKKQSSRTNLISACSTNNKPDIEKTIQDNKIKDFNEEKDNEYKTKEISSNDNIDRNNLIESIINKDIKSWTKIEEKTKLESSKIVPTDRTMFVRKNVHEMCTVSPKVSSSTSRLRNTFENNTKSPRFNNKRSQDRFPFTISETENTMLETRHNVGRCNNVTNKSRSLETFRELPYPTITEFFVSPNDYYAYNERQEQRNILPKMKGFVRKFSNKLKSSLKHNNNDHHDHMEISTKIIYQNQECQVDSIAESFSDESIIEESQLIVPKSANTRSSIISSGKSLKKTMSLENLTLCTEYPRRRYDRDDRWVKEFQECSSQRTTTRTSSKERFSIFPSKSESSSLVEDISKESSRLEDNNIPSNNYKNEDSMMNVSTSSFVLPNSMKTKFNVEKDQNPDTDDISINNMETGGCICFKLYQILTCSFIVTSKDRTSIAKPNESLIEMKKKKKKRKKKFGLSLK